MILSMYEKGLLDVVISVAGDDEKMIRNGIVKALIGENEKGRRNYLWHTLKKAAEAKIRRVRKKYCGAT